MNLKIIIAIVIAALVTSNGVQFLYTKNVKADRDRYKTERNAARAENSQCQQDKALTERVSNANQKRVADLEHRIADRDRVRGNPKCKPVITR